MRELTIRQTRAALAEIENLLAREGEILVTRRGRPVARLLPVARNGATDHAALRQRMRRLETPSARWIRRARDERG